MTRVPTVPLEVAAIVNIRMTLHGSDQGGDGHSPPS